MLLRTRRLLAPSAAPHSLRTSTFGIFIGTDNTFGIFIGTYNTFDILDVTDLAEHVQRFRSDGLHGGDLQGGELLRGPVRSDGRPPAPA
jgi:hypothetical protein